MLNDRQLVPDDTPALPGEVVHHNRPVKVHTLFGTVILKRRYLHHPRSGTGRVPLDLALDLVGRHTPVVAKLMCRAATDTASYGDAARGLAAYTGLELEERSFQRMVNRVGPDLIEAISTIREPLEPKPIPILYVETDGTGLPCRPEELAGRPGKQPDGTSRTRESKLGAIFTQTTTDKDGLPMRDPDSTTYTGTMGDCRASGELLRAEALRRGLGLAELVVFIGDGAAWIWENARIYFPSAIQILDFYHAVEHLGLLAMALLGANERAASQQRAWASKLKDSDATGVIQQALRMIDANPQLGAESLEAARREIAYFTTHAERTRYGYFREQGYFIGSGVIEAGCKTVVGRRLKQSGMFWGLSGAENILQMRCIIKGQHFDAAWQARRPLLADRQRKARRWKNAA